MPWSRNTSRLCLILTLWAACAALAGCGGKSKPAQDGGGSPSDQQMSVAMPRTAADEWPSPDDDACTAFGAAFEKAVQERNTPTMNELIDWDTILEKVVGGTEGADPFVGEFIKGAKIGISGANGLAGELSKVIGQGGTYKFMRIRTRDGQKSALFRQMSREVGVNYHEFLLALNPQGKVRAADVYVYLTAENVSTTIRRMFLPVAAHQNRSFLARLTGQESDFVKNVDKLSKMKEKIRSGQFMEALQIFNALPESLRRDKTFLLMRAQAAMQVGDQEYLQTLNDFLRFHPGDPCVDMLSIDYFALNKQYDKTLASLDRMNEAVGGDPYLSVLKGNAYVSLKDVAKAREMFQAAMDAEPSLLEAYTGMADISLVEKNFADTVRWLSEVKNRFQIELTDLTTIPEYAEFVKSPEYQAWSAGQVPSTDQ